MNWDIEISISWSGVCGEGGADIHNLQHPVWWGCEEPCQNGCRSNHQVGKTSFLISYNPLHCHRCQNHYKREFQMIGKSFSQLGQAMEGDGGNYNPGLNNAVIATGSSLPSVWKSTIDNLKHFSTGECYEEIGRLYEEQPRLDWEHLADMMHDYKGLLAGWPQVLHIHSVCFVASFPVTFGDNPFLSGGPGQEEGGWWWKHSNCCWS